MRIRRSLLALLIGSGVFLWSSASLSQSGGGGGDSLGQKQENKRRSGWTLQEWLETKERNRLMDQWLMLHSTPNLYEFYLGYEPSTSLDKQGRGQDHGEKINALAYATLVGVSLSYLTNGSGWNSGLRLRVLGSSDQTTNLTLEYGLRNRDFLDEEMQNQTASVLATLNLTEVFGLTGSYQRVFDAEVESGETLGGRVIKGGLFLDFGSLRIQGVWYRQELQVSGEESSQTGIFGSVGLYF